MVRCELCASLISELSLFARCLGQTPTSIVCNAELGCTRALPIQRSDLHAPPAQVVVARTKQQVRDMLHSRPEQNTCLVTTTRCLAGLESLWQSAGCVQVHKMASDTPLGLLLNAEAKRPSPVVLYHVPPDSRGRAECHTLAHAALADEQLDMVFPALAAAAHGAGEKQVRCLLDSGASACFVSQDLVRKLKLPMQQAALKSVTTAAGRTVPIAGMVSMELRMGDARLNVAAQVLPCFLSEVQLILGQDFMREHEVQLRFDAVPSRCSLRCPETQQRMELSRHMQMATSKVAGAVGVASIADQSSHGKQATPSLGMTAAVAARLLRRHAGKAFVALLRPVSAGRGVVPGGVAAVALDVSSLPSETGTVPVGVAGEEPVRPKLDHVPAALRSELQGLLDEFSDVFSESPQAGGALVDMPEHTIQLEPGATPPFRRNFRLSPLELQELRKQVTELLSKGLVTPSSSPFGAPVLFVPKPNGGLRFCLDYRALNELTVKMRWPLPRIDDLLDAARGAKFKSSLDMAGGYHQIRIAPEDVPKTAFGTPFGHYEWQVLPMGLTNAPSTFQRTMNKVFEPYLKVPGPVSDLVSDGAERFVLVYLDDVLCLSASAEEHMRHLRLLFEKLREHRLQAKLSKCKFMQRELKFLGHILAEDGVKPDPGKIQALLDWPFPENAVGMQQFLGLANYFRKFIPDYARIASPLYELTKKQVPFQEGEETRQAFEQVKKLLIEPPLLAYPNPDLPYELISDASVTGCGAVLTQEGRPIAYYSSKFSGAERNYTTGEQELLGLIKALKEWRCYLEGCAGLTLVTDHNPLTWFSSQPSLSRRQARWAEFLSRFHPFEVKYRPGSTNPADSLSRLHGTAANAPKVVAAAVTRRTAREFKSEWLSKIKAATSQDAHFADERAVKQYVKQDGYWTYQNRIVVPASLRTELLQSFHNSPTAGHFGWARTLELVERQFWWPRLRDEVKAFVKACPSCQANKATNHRPFGLLNPLQIPDTRWHTVTMDFITDLPPTTAGHDAILVFVDKLTKYVHLVPTNKSCTSEELSRLFLEHIFQNHGMIKVLISDRDPRFTSKFWDSFCASLGIESRQSTAFHPQTDGQTERMNRVLEEVLRHFVDEDHSNWDRLLPLVAFAMNNAVAASTGHTPFYLNYGAHPLTPVTAGLLSGKLPNLDAVLSDLDATLQKVKKLHAAAQDRQKAYADKARAAHGFKAGQMVLLSSRNLKFKQGVKKLHPKYVGPFRILKMVGENAAKLELSEAYARLHPVFHVSMLKEYKEGPGAAPKPPKPDIVDGEPYYKVERILSMRESSTGKGRGKKRREFLIKWTGYDDSHNSWEPETNLTPDLLKSYLAR